MRRRKISLCLMVAMSFLAACASPDEQAKMEGHPTPTNVRPVATEALRSSLHEAAVAAERAHDYTAAVTFYNSLYDRDPDDLKAAFGLSRNLRFVGAYVQAMDILERAIEDHPDNAELPGELGKVQLASGRPEEAVASLMKAREMGPKDWRVHSALGIAFDRLGRYDSAAVSYAAALALSPNNLSVLNNMALSLVQTGEIERGIELLTRAASSRQASIQIRQNLAMVHAINGDIDKAERLARQDLPEKMVEANVEFYRRLAASAATDGVGAVIQPVSTAAPPHAIPGPVQIEPWDEDTEAERAEAKP
jgi:Flp pilus assembly protein TadD